MTTLMKPVPARRRRSEQSSRGDRGQALVEFSIALIHFLIALMGVLDLGRGIFAMNGTASAAREIARVTSVHAYDVCCDLGSSDEAADVIATQRGLVPGMAFTPSTDIVCVDASDAVIPDANCRPGDYVRVHLRAPFTPVTPIVSAFGSQTFESYSRIRIP